MNVLFVNANLYGHINPTLGLVRQLTKSGNHVDYFCSEKFAEQIKDIGAKWIGFSPKLEQFLIDYRPTDRHPFFMLMEYMLLYDEVVLPEILDLIDTEKFDLIICDSIFGGGCFLNQIITTPIVCSNSSFAMSCAPVPPRMLVPGFHPQLDHCYEILHRICERYSIAVPTIETVFIGKAKLNIVYTSKSFNGDDGVCEPEYLFTGPSIIRKQETLDFDWTKIGNRAVIYISLGSLNTDFIDFFKLCVQTFKNTDYFVIMSIGKKCDAAQLGEIPGNFLVRNFLPQLDILKHTDVFVTHAGFNSVNEALYYGVPMLALPKVNDQHMVAKRLVTLGLGLSADMGELNEQMLFDKTRIIMNTATYKEKCLAMSQEMKKASQWNYVIKKLEAYANNGEVRN